MTTSAMITFSDTYGHTPYDKAFTQGDVYGIGFDAERAARKKIRLGISGAGGVAQSKYLPAIARLRMIWEPVEVIAFAEPRSEQRAKVASVYGGRAYAEFGEMLAQEELDAVLITSSDTRHCEQAVAALENGLPVLVEKPIARSLADADKMCRTAEQHGVLLMSVAMMRYAPPYARAWQLVQDGPVSNPAMFVGKFNLGYDYVDLFESGTIHFFDLNRYLMGDVAAVRAVGVNRYGDNRRNYPIDNAIVTLEYTSGAIGTLYTSSSALSFKPWTRVEVYGRHAWLAVEDQSELLLYEGEETPALLWKPVMPNTLLLDEEFGGYMGHVENFLQAVRGNEPPRVVGWDGYRALELAWATHLSLARGERVTLPLDPASADADVSAWLAQHNRVGV